MFYLTGSRNNICSIAVSLLLMTAFYFKPSYVSHIIQRRSCSSSAKVNRHFEDTLKIWIIIIWHVIIFTIDETFFQNVKKDLQVNSTIYNLCYGLNCRNIIPTQLFCLGHLSILRQDFPGNEQFCLDYSRGFMLWPKHNLHSIICQPAILQKSISR